MQVQNKQDRVDIIECVVIHIFGDERLKLVFKHQESFICFTTLKLLKFYYLGYKQWHCMTFYIIYRHIFNYFYIPLVMQLYMFGHEPNHKR